MERHDVSSVSSPRDPAPAPPELSPAEHLLRARLAAVVETTDDAVITKNLDGVIQTWNNGATRVFGYTAEEAIGQPILLLIPPERHGEEETILGKLRRGERIEHYETVRRRKDGQLIDVSLSVAPVRDSTGKVVAASKIARDITARKRLDAERDQLLESERTARAEAERISLSKDDFLAMLSHELRTPLNAILGWAQVLRGPNIRAEDLREGLEVIERNTRVQGQLIEELLDMSRIVSGKVRLDVKTVDLQDVVKAALESVRHAAESRGIRLKAILDTAAGPVRGDDARLQQCFWNLLTNAIKFTPKGGSVIVTLERVNSHVQVSVADSGQGISPDFLPHVFERFRQADQSTTRRHGGLGLGLAIVKQLVELHGGRVRVSSPGLGQGATFTIELPVTSVRPTPGREEESGRHRPLTADLPSLEGLLVLVVEDEPDSRGLTKRVLEESGARVLIAGSAAEGMDLLVAERPHLILSDIGMPDVDGYQFIQQVRSLPPDRGGRTPAVAVTAFARPQDRTKALLAGFQTHLPKPVEPMELIATVASLASRPGKKDTDTNDGAP